MGKGPPGGGPEGLDGDFRRVMARLVIGIGRLGELCGWSRMAHSMLSCPRHLRVTGTGICTIWVYGVSTMGRYRHCVGGCKIHHIEPARISGMLSRQDDCYSRQRCKKQRRMTCLSRNHRCSRLKILCCKVQVSRFLSARYITRLYYLSPAKPKHIERLPFSWRAALLEFPPLWSFTTSPIP